MHIRLPPLAGGVGHMPVWQLEHVQASIFLTLLIVDNSRGLVLGEDRAAAQIVLDYVLHYLDEVYCCEGVAPGELDFGSRLVGWWAGGPRKVGEVEGRPSPPFACAGI